MRAFTPVHEDTPTTGFRDRRRHRRVLHISIMAHRASWAVRRHRAWLEVDRAIDAGIELRT